MFNKDIRKFYKEILVDIKAAPTLWLSSHETGSFKKFKDGITLSHSMFTKWQTYMIKRTIRMETLKFMRSWEFRETEEVIKLTYEQLHSDAWPFEVGEVYVSAVELTIQKLEEAPPDPISALPGAGMAASLSKSTVLSKNSSFLFLGIHDRVERLGARFFDFDERTDYPVSLRIYKILWNGCEYGICCEPSYLNYACKKAKGNKNEPSKEA